MGSGEDSSVQGIDGLARDVRSVTERLRQARSVAGSAKAALGDVNERLVAETPDVPRAVVADVGQVELIEAQTGVERVDAQPGWVDLTDTQAGINELASGVAAVAGDLVGLQELVGQSEERMVARVAVELSTVNQVSAKEIARVVGDVRSAVELAQSAQASADVAVAGMGEVEERLGANISDVSRAVEAQAGRMESVDARLGGVEALASEVAGISRELSSVKNVSTQEIARVVGDVRSAVELARGAQVAASDSAGLAAALERLSEVEAHVSHIQSVGELAAKVETLRDEVEESIASLRWLVEEVLIVTNERASRRGEEEIDLSDRYRDRWEEHLRLQTELRHQRSKSSDYEPPF